MIHEDIPDRKTLGPLYSNQVQVEAECNNCDFEQKGMPKNATKKGSVS